MKELNSTFSKLADKLRAFPLAILFLVTFAVVLFIAPQKAGLAIWGISKLALGGYIGYWTDRTAFRPEDRPHKLEGVSKGTAWKRRACIISAALIATALLP